MTTVSCFDLKDDYSSKMNFPYLLGEGNPFKYLIIVQNIIILLRNYDK